MLRLPGSLSSCIFTSLIIINKINSSKSIIKTDGDCSILTLCFFTFLKLSLEENIGNIVNFSKDLLVKLLWKNILFVLMKRKDFQLSKRKGIFFNDAC